MYDFFLAKNGIAAPVSHPLRIAVSRHKARLSAELTKARLKRGCASVEDLRKLVNENAIRRNTTPDDAVKRYSHPRWIRINTLRTTVDEQLQTTFSNYKQVDSLDQIIGSASSNNCQNILYRDRHIPGLLALPITSDVQTSHAYHDGLIILQDKASCFPAYMLDPISETGDILDACAAPGNKTTHLAAIINSRSSSTKCKIWACERDRERATSLQNMVNKAGAQKIAVVKPGQDFLKIDPQKTPWNNVQYLLLDPSCSGSGIIGRDETLNIALPKILVDERPNHLSKKRKRAAESENRRKIINPKEDIVNETTDSETSLDTRLEALSAFQTKLLLHAFAFPRAQRITYSTCSIYEKENEHVVLRALSSPVATQRRWRILERGTQVSGAKDWAIRGNRAACESWSVDGDVQTVAEACIRCERGTEEGTQGFFVAGFVRDDAEDIWSSTALKATSAEEVFMVGVEPRDSRELEDDVDEDWNGFKD